MAPANEGTPTPVKTATIRVFVRPAWVRRCSIRSFRIRGEANWLGVEWGEQSRPGTKGGDDGTYSVQCAVVVRYATADDKLSAGVRNKRGNVNYIDWKRRRIRGSTMDNRGS